MPQTDQPEARDYAKTFDRSQVVDGVLICDCLTVGTPNADRAVAVAKLMPREPVLIDVQEFQYGQRIGICATFPDGRRHAVKIKTADGFDASLVADALDDWRRDNA
jgi:hypothetical protein